MTALVALAFQAPFHSSRLQIIANVSDPIVLKTLREIPGAQVLEVGRSREKLLRMVADASDADLKVLLSHNDGFHFRDAAGAGAKVPVEEVERAILHSKAPVIVASCEAGSRLGMTGPIVPFYEREFARHLADASTDAHSYGEWFQRLKTPVRLDPYFVDALNGRRLKPRLFRGNPPYSEFLVTGTFGLSTTNSGASAGSATAADSPSPPGEPRESKSRQSQVDATTIQDGPSGPAPKEAMTPPKAPEHGEGKTSAVSLADLAWALYVREVAGLSENGPQQRGIKAGATPSNMQPTPEESRRLGVVVILLAGAAILTLLVFAYRRPRRTRR